MAQRRDITGRNAALSTPRVRAHRQRRSASRRDPLRRLSLWLPDSQISALALDMKTAQPGDASRVIEDERQWLHDVEQAICILIDQHLAERARKNK